tara:strand:+ start:42 stop:446 length:405 start_codon:yes stop_codon:yes gene_type:complete
MNPLKQNAPIDPATGMPVAQPQLGQMAQNPYPNQNALGPAQAKIPGMFPGSAFNQGQQTFGILSAKTSKEAGISEAKRLAAQEDAKKKRDAVSGKEETETKTKTDTPPTKTYSNEGSNTIYNKDGSVSAKQTIK